jgi:hypothetical protein
MTSRAVSWSNRKKVISLTGSDGRRQTTFSLLTHVWAKARYNPSVLLHFLEIGFHNGSSPFTVHRNRRLPDIRTINDVQHKLGKQMLHRMMFKKNKVELERGRGWIAPHIWQEGRTT